MTKLTSPYFSYIETITTHLTRSQNSHHNQRASFMKAALLSLEKLRFELNRELSLLTDKDEPKKGDYKQICELCGLQLPSVRSTILGHYIPYYVCEKCFTLNESIKRAMNVNLPHSSHFPLSSFNEELKKVGYKLGEGK